MRQDSLFDELDPAEEHPASTSDEPTSNAADAPAATAAPDQQAGESPSASKATVRYAASDFWEHYQQLRHAADSSTDSSEEEQPPTRITLQRLTDQ